MDWTILFYSAKVKQDLEKLPESIRLKLEHYFDMIEEIGPFLPMPHARPMGDGLLELRPSGKEGIGRVFYCAVSKQRVIVLHSFVKKTQRTPNKELNIARQRQKEVQKYYER